MNFQDMIAANKAAALQQGQIKLGEAAIVIGARAVSKTLPLYLRGYVEHPLGKFAIGNLIAIAAEQGLKNNPKAQVIGHATRNAAMLKLFNQFDIDAMVNKLLGHLPAEAAEPGVEGVPPVDLTRG